MPSIGEIIKQYRLKAGLSQQQLGEKLGLASVARQRVAQWENGYRTPASEHLLKLMAVLNIPPEEFDEYRKGVNMETESLLALTRQESGVVLYDGGDLIICNWSNIDGMPRLSPCGLGLLGLNEELVVEGEPQRIEDIGAWLDTQEHRVIYDANDDYPLLAGLAGKLYRVNGAYVIAPNGWN